MCSSCFSLPPISRKKFWIDLAWRFCSEPGFGTCGSKFRENRPLFIGVLVTCCREQGVLPVLSIIGLQITTYTKKSKRERILTWRTQARVILITMPGLGRRKSGYGLGWPLGSSCWADGCTGPVSGLVQEKKGKEGNRKWIGWRIWPERVLGLKKILYIF
jgi:hypothetical protein